MVYDKVIEYCTKNGISICAFEQMCGIGNGVVSKWENDGSLPTLKTLKKIEDKTKIPVKKWLE